MTADERRDVLAATTARWVRAGGRVETSTDFQTVIVYGRRPNHLLHLFLTIFTIGLWAPVWLFLGLFGGERRKTLTVYEDGEVGVT